MPCYGPLTAYYSAEVNSSGKRSLIFDKKKSYSGVPLRIPCGKCIGCKLERSRQWAMRCVHENRMHKRSVFVTLTYDDDHLPKGGTLVKKDLSTFINNLREYHRYHTGEKMKFYACGEYGETTRRPHYHAILFGIDFTDRRKSGANRRGDAWSTSKTLTDIWGNGHTLCGDVTFDSCAYVARYVTKKITGPKADAHYTVQDGNGEVFTLLPEFTLMSRRPGIGHSYFSKYGAEIYGDPGSPAPDNVIINGKAVPPPRAYDLYFGLQDPEKLAKTKVLRRRKALLNKADNTSRRRLVRETVVRAKLKLKKGNL